MSGWMFTLSGVARVNVIISSARRRAVVMDEVRAAMDDVGTSFNAMTVESLIVVRHLGIRLAGVEGRHHVRMMRSLSG